MSELLGQKLSTSFCEVKIMKKDGVDEKNRAKCFICKRRSVGEKEKNHEREREIVDADEISRGK